MAGAEQKQAAAGDVLALVLWGQTMIFTSSAEKGAENVRLCKREIPKLCFALLCRVGRNHPEACSRLGEHFEAGISGEEISR